MEPARVTVRAVSLSPRSDSLRLSLVLLRRNGLQACIPGLLGVWFGIAAAIGNTVAAGMVCTPGSHS